MGAGTSDDQTAPEDPKYLTLEEVAEELRVRPATVRLWLDDPSIGLRGYQLGKVIRIRRDDLDAWIEQEAIQKTGERRERLRGYRSEDPSDASQSERKSG